MQPNVAWGDFFRQFAQGLKVANLVMRQCSPWPSPAAAQRERGLRFPPRVHRPPHSWNVAYAFPLESSPPLANRLSMATVGEEWWCQLVVTVY
mmetsp:Transcript_13321/g.40393  ORF Transcript_13321/g.40393 Transcript_13321/m.40393 type:complete len:93 (+) Transcript_13321:761-1039(+)